MLREHLGASSVDQLALPSIPGRQALPVIETSIDHLGIDHVGKVVGPDVRPFNGHAGRQDPEFHVAAAASDREERVIDAVVATGQVPDPRIAEVAGVDVAPTLQRCPRVGTAG